MSKMFQISYELNGGQLGIAKVTPQYVIGRAVTKPHAIICTWTMSGRPPANPT